MNVNNVKVAGVSREDGVLKMRTAMNLDYVKSLTRREHADIDLMELPETMTKQGAAEYLLSIGFDEGDDEVRSCLQEVIVKAQAKQDKIAKKAALKAAPEVTPTPTTEPDVVTDTVGDEPAFTEEDGPVTFTIVDGVAV